MSVKATTTVSTSPLSTERVSSSRLSTSASSAGCAAGGAAVPRTRNSARHEALKQRPRPRLLIDQLLGMALHRKHHPVGGFDRLHDSIRAPGGGAQARRQVL